MDGDNISQLFSRKEVWLIYLYQGQTAKPREVDLLKKMSEKYYEDFKIAAVDCSQQRDVCENQLQQSAG